MNENDNCVNMENSSGKVWLIKVPKYLSSRMKIAKPMTEIGKIKIISYSDDEQNILFNLSKEIVESKTSSDSKENSLIPREHQFLLTKNENQTLAIFSHNNKSMKVSIDGSVTQKGECRPVMNSNYLTLNKERVKKAAKPLRVVQQLDRTVVVFKPISTHKTNNFGNNINKNSSNKRYKRDKEIVKNILFKAFEKHQFYTIKDLEKITQQPILHLKEVLKQICNYNVKYPHKNMWELKPEFRHYKQD